MQLAFRQHGHGGSPVLVLHGLFGSADNWHSFCRKLALTYQVFALDLRNHGDSPHSEEMSYPAMAKDLLEFLQIHQLEAAHVLGHSMGGKVALQFALSYPERTLSITSVDMGPGAYGPRHEDILQAMLKLDLSQFSARKEIEDALAEGIPDLATRRFLLKNVRRREDGFQWRLGLKEIAAAYPRLNEAIESDRHYPGPALLVRGEQSDYLQEGDLANIRRTFPQAEFAAVAGAGHLVHVDRPEELHAIVARFLESTGAMLSSHLNRP